MNRRALVDIRILQREYLLAISRALTAELDLRDVLRIILQSAVELVKANAGMIVLAEPEEETFRVTAVYGIPTHAVQHFAPLLRVPYVDGQEHLAVPELTHRLQQIGGRVGLGLKQMLRIPMVSGGEVIGLIYLFQSDTYYMIEDALTLLRSFGDQAAIAVRNAQLYQQVIKEKKRLDAILENSADGVMILDPSLRITGFNQALSNMTGWPAAEAIGRPHEEVLHWLTLKTDTGLEQALENGWPLPGAAHLYVEGDVRCHGNQHQLRDRVSLGITYAPLLSENGRLTDIIANVRDLTRYREEEALQKTFISVISHELKTPVSIIKGYAGTLARQDANWSPDVIRESLAVIEEEADSLTDLIDNLLEASRLQAGTFALEMSDEVALPLLAEKVARKLGGQSEKHTISVQFPANYPTIIADERRLTQVLNNLVSNAIKYSPDGGPIVISGAVHPEHITVSVRDAGIGIPAHEQGRIFQKFSRLDNALSRRTEGTGLGLFLSKAIVEAHNGRLWFNNNASETEPEAAGATFTFSLPVDFSNQ